MGDIKDTKYLDGIWMNYNGDPRRWNRRCATRWRRRMASGRRTDNAIYVANIMEQLAQFRIISLGLQVLLLFIGALTLGIAGIGLMNIMLVSVQQRTREIGVEKALGARKRHILLQFLAEALVITGVGGVAGHRAGVCGERSSLASITFYSATGFAMRARRTFIC